MKITKILSLIFLTYALQGCLEGAKETASTETSGNGNTEVGASTANLEWTTSNWDENLFLPRMNLTANWVGQDIILYGGYDGLGNGNHFTSGVKYNPQTNNWNLISSVGAPTGREYHRSAVINDKLLIFMGDNSYSANLDNYGRIYNPQTDSWSKMSVNGLQRGCYFQERYAGAPGSATAHGVTQSKLLVWSTYYGQTSSTCTVPTKQVYFGIYDINSNRWTEGNVTGGPTTAGPSGITTDYGFVLWGGTYPDPHNDPKEILKSNEGYLYNANTNTWERMANADGFIKGAAVPLMATSGDLLVVWGGVQAYPNGWNNEGAVYNLKTKTWKKMNSHNAPPPTAQFNYSDANITHYAQIVDDRYFVVWGRAGIEPMQGGIYDMEKDEWLNMPMDNAHLAGEGLAGVPYKKGLLLFGGRANYYPYPVTSIFSYLGVVE